MSGITSTLDIAKRALITHQLSTQVASHNIANADTPGFSRQTLSLTTALATPSPVGLIGNGVYAEEITRHYDSFIGQRITDQNSDLGFLEAQTQTFQILDAVFDETGGYALNDLMNQFWDSWQSLADYPEATTSRQEVVQQGQAVADYLQQVYGEITNLRNETNANIDATVDDINSLTAQIAAVNQQIINADTDLRNPNDLLDQRDQLVVELSKLIDIHYFEQKSGSYTIMLPDGHTLVEDNTNNILTWKNAGLYWQGGSGSQVLVNNSSKMGGKLGGLIDMQERLAENDPTNYLGQLDNFANALIREVNQQYSQGVGLVPYSTALTGSATTDPLSVPPYLLGSLDYGAGIQTTGSFDLWLYNPDGTLALAAPVTVSLAGLPAPPTMPDVAAAINTAVTAAAGAPWLTASVDTAGRLTITPDGSHHFAFANDSSNLLQAAGLNTFFTGFNSGTIGVNDAVANNLDLVAAAQITATGDIFQGDNRNALLLNTLRQNENVSFNDGTTSSLDNYYNALVTTIGLDSKSASWNQESTRINLDSLNALRDSVSGVSLDEEMANLIKYQQAYTAAAKLITISDEMLTTLLNSI